MTMTFSETAGRTPWSTIQIITVGVQNVRTTPTMFMFFPPQGSRAGHHRGRVRVRRTTMLGPFSIRTRYEYLHGTIVHPTCRYVSVRCQTQNKPVRIYIVVLTANAAAVWRDARARRCSGRGRLFLFRTKNTRLYVYRLTDSIPTSGVSNIQAWDRGWSTAESKSESAFRPCYVRADSVAVFRKSPLCRRNNVGVRSNANFTTTPSLQAAPPRNSFVR